MTRWCVDMSLHDQRVFVQASGRVVHVASRVPRPGLATSEAKWMACVAV